MNRRVRDIYNGILLMIELLIDEDPYEDTPEGALLRELSEACEKYEKAISQELVQ